MKTISQLLTMVLLAAFLAACGSEPTPDGQQAETAPGKQSARPSPPETRAAEATSTESGASGGSERIYEKEGGFSYVPPERWRVREFPGLEYKVAGGIRSDRFTPNINVVDVPYGGPLDEEFVEANIETMRRIFHGFRIVAWDDFRTDEGEHGIRLVTEQRIADGTKLRQTQYLFDGGSRKIVVTCSRLADKQQAVDAACDESMKTFRIESQ